MFIRLIIAALIAVFVSGFYAGYLSGNNLFIIDLIAIAAFAIATLSTVLANVFIASLSGSAPANTASTSKVSVESGRENGIVKWFNINKGFGFITRENGEDIFVHYRSIRGEGRRRLFDGQNVEFSIIDSDKGLQADDVVAK